MRLFVSSTGSRHGSLISMPENVAKPMGEGGVGGIVEIATGANHTRDGGGATSMMGIAPRALMVQSKEESSRKKNYCQWKKLLGKAVERVALRRS